MKQYLLFVGVVVASLQAPSALADSSEVYSAASPGETERTSAPTNNFARLDSQSTGTQRVALPKAGFGVLSPAIPGASRRNGLPDTRLDGLVNPSDARSEIVFGGEGNTGPPPVNGFEMQNRIGPTLNPGLSTGHGSYLPSAQGAEGEFSHSGGFTPGAGDENPLMQLMESDLRQDMDGFPDKNGDSNINR